MNYENLSLLPWMIAETVCNEPYLMQEYSEGCRSKKNIEEVENKRKTMRGEQIKEFGVLCDTKCRGAFKAKAKWFMDCVNTKGNKGRDQLYVWIRHWMTAYLKTGKV